MKYLEDLVTHLIDTARRAEQEKYEKNKPMTLTNFKFERTAKRLVEPARSCAAHHRFREQFYVKELERAEKDLREKGITTEVVDAAGTPVFTGGMAAICSGSISYGSHPSQVAPKFQAKADPVLLAAVERNKNKMIEHGRKADQYEKYARAFACAPLDASVELSVDDVNFFRLDQ